MINNIMEYQILIV